LAGLVSLVEPSLFTPERVANIIGLAGMKPETIYASILTFGRHFASSWVTGAMLNLFVSHHHRLHFSPHSEWEYREGILSLTSVVSYVASSSSSTTDGLSPQQAAETYFALLSLAMSGWRHSTDRTMDDTGKRSEGDDELMDAVGQALRDLVGDSEDTWKQVETVFTSRSDEFYATERERMRAVVERSLSAQQDDPLLAFFRSTTLPTPPFARRR
jgi:hypothetical protein